MHDFSIRDSVVELKLVILTADHIYFEIDLASVLCKVALIYLLLFTVFFSDIFPGDYLWLKCFYSAIRFKGNHWPCERKVINGNQFSFKL